MDKLSYALGMVIAENLKGLGANNVDTTDFAKAVADVLAGKSTELTPIEAQTTVQEFMQKQEAERSKFMRKAGEDFLAENAKKPGVKTLPSGVQYRVIKEGSGAIAKDTSAVKVHYEGKTIDGKVFDSSYQRGEPVTMRANQVIKGWTDVLTRMPAGSVWEVYIPEDQAYGSREQPNIKPYSALIFKIELISVGEK